MSNLRGPFRPLQLDKVEEGRFLDRARSEFVELHRALCAYIEEHGEASEKAVATLTLKVKLKVEDPDGGTVSIKTLVDPKMAPPPTQVTTAFVNEDEDGLGLFARTSGTDAYPEPRQQKLCTDAGEIVAEVRVPSED